MDRGAQQAQRVGHDRRDLAQHSTPMQFPLLLTSCMSVVYLLLLQSWYGDIIINQSPWFPVDFTVCVIKVYGFWQTHSILYPPLHYHTNWFHCCENPLCCSCSSLVPPRSLETTDFFFFFTISVVLLFPKYYTVGTVQLVAVAGSSTVLDSRQVILICPSLENH